ncbi:MAG: polysaccharide deacetylase family protein [Coriobacteriia bacterium]|nr:polysaccharide deacetylase family protein [Coriobacteriia bacterium]
MRVALTFDTEPVRGGNDPECARRILDALEAEGARATFFVQGEWAEEHPDLAARLNGEGHRVGNHTYSHALPGALPAEELRLETVRAEAVIERLTGRSPRPYFRCPQNSGAFDAGVLDRIKEGGYRQVGWHVDSLDWQATASAETVTERVLAAVDEHGDGTVVLFHSWPDATAEALPAILSGLKERGAEPVTLDELELDSLPVACVQPVSATAGTEAAGRGLATSTLWGLASKLVTVAGNLLVGIIIARALGPEGKGAYAWVLQVVGILVVLLGMGLGTSNIYYVASGKVPIRTAVANSLALLPLTGSIAAGACLLLIAGPLAPDDRFSSGMALLAVGLFVSTTLYTWLGAAAVGRSGLRPRAIAGMTSVATVLVAAVVLWFLGMLSATSMVAAGVLGQVLATVVVIVAGGAPMLSLSPDWRALREMVGYSARSYVVELVNFIHLRIDIILLGWLATTATVGIYSVGVSLAEVARYVPGVAGAALFARASQVAGARGSELSARMSRLTVLLVVVSVLVFGLLAPLLIPALFGSAFSEAVTVLLVLLPGVAAISIAEVPGAYLFSRKVIYWRTSAIVVALNVAINIVLIPRYGAAGAAVASSLTYTLLMVIVIALMRRESGLGVRDILVPTPDDVRTVFAVLRRHVAR